MPFLRRYASQQELAVKEIFGCDDLTAIMGTRSRKWHATRSAQLLREGKITQQEHEDMRHYRRHSTETALIYYEMTSRESRDAAASRRFIDMGIDPEEGSEPSASPSKSTSPPPSPPTGTSPPLSPPTGTSPPPSPPTWTWTSPPPSPSRSTSPPPSRPPPASRQPAANPPPPPAANPPRPPAANPPPPPASSSPPVQQYYDMLALRRSSSHSGRRSSVVGPDTM